MYARGEGTETGLLEGIILVQPVPNETKPRSEGFASQ